MANTSCHPWPPTTACNNLVRATTPPHPTSLPLHTQLCSCWCMAAHYSGGVVVTNSWRMGARPHSRAAGWRLPGDCHATHTSHKWPPSHAAYGCILVPAPVPSLVAALLTSRVHTPPQRQYIAWQSTQAATPLQQQSSQAWKPPAPLRMLLACGPAGVQVPEAECSCSQRLLDGFRLEHRHIVRERYSWLVSMPIPATQWLGHWKPT
jgi:hypothetical protein